MDTYPSRHLTHSPPFPFNNRQQHQEQDKMIFGNKTNFTEIKPELSEKRSSFRFEHMATEFENKMNESDSGIEDVSTVSPGSTASFSSFSSLSPGYPEQREPLSLVVRDRSSSSDSSSTPTTTKHWKKSISRNYSGEDRENGPLSPSTSTTAEALLSLGKSIPPTMSTSSAPISNRLPVPVAPTRPVSSLHHRIVQPWAIPTPTSVTSMTIHSAVTSEHANITSVGSHTVASLARKGPSDISNLSSQILFPSHPLPPIHFKTEPEMGPVPLLTLPQQPAPLREVKSNLQLSTKPPFSVAGKIKTEPLSWHLSPLSPLSNSNNSLFRHTAFSSENLAESSAAKDKPFHCHECKKSFSTQSGFAKHQQLHCSNQIQRETTCKYCNKSYTSNSALKMHIRTHTLPCKCHECGKSFSRPWLLQGHLRTHTGEKPFACTECSRTFADKSNLRAHLQTHLQNKKYSCPGCQKTFSRMSLLTKHTDSGCLGLQSRNEECVETLTMMSSGLLRS